MFYQRLKDSWESWLDPIASQDIHNTHKGYWRPFFTCLTDGEDFDREY